MARCATYRGATGVTVRLTAAQEQYCASCNAWPLELHGVALRVDEGIAEPTYGDELSFQASLGLHLVPLAGTRIIRHKSRRQHSEAAKYYWVVNGEAAFATPEAAFDCLLGMGEYVA